VSQLNVKFHDIYCYSHTDLLLPVKKQLQFHLQSVANMTRGVTIESKHPYSERET
jgi:hypothetical protein